MENIKEQLEEVIKKNLPMKYDIGEENYDLKDRHLEYNEAINDVDTSLIAYEVLKVVVEKIENVHSGEIEEVNNSNNQELTKKYIIAGLEVYKDSLLSNLSPNKENEK